MGLWSSWGFCAFIFFSNDVFESKSSKEGKAANQGQIGAVQSWFVAFGFLWPSSVGWNWKPPPKDDKVVAENTLWLGFLGGDFCWFSTLWDEIFIMKSFHWQVFNHLCTGPVHQILCYMLSNSMYKHCFWRWPTLHHWTCSWFVEIFEGWHSEGWSKAKMATDFCIFAIWVVETFISAERRSSWRRKRKPKRLSLWTHVPLGCEHAGALQ